MPRKFGISISQHSWTQVEIKTNVSNKKEKTEGNGVWGPVEVQSCRVHVGGDYDDEMEKACEQKGYKKKHNNTFFTILETASPCCTLQTRRRGSPPSSSSQRRASPSAPSRIVPGTPHSDPTAPLSTR